YELAPDYGGEWMFGRFCYWCGDRRLGDYELGTSLRDVLFQLERVVGDAGRRTNARFDTISATEAFHILDDALFGSTESKYFDVADEEQWARHNILPPVDVFNNCKAYVIDEAGVARVIYASDPYEEVQQFRVNSEEVDSALVAARNSLSEIYEQET